MVFDEFVQQAGEPMEIEARYHLFRQGDASASLYVVREGLLKAYYLTPDGKESIKSFIMAGDMIGSLSAVHGKAECSFSLESQTPCQLVKLSFQSLYDASKSNVEIGAAVIDFLLSYGAKKERREYELLCLSAEERYRLLRENAPAVLDMVSQQEIALYLGVTPGALSRIKRRINSV